jgi:hypothetical protein
MAILARRFSPKKLLQPRRGSPAGACDGEIVRRALPIADVFRKMKIILA